MPKFNNSVLNPGLASQLVALVVFTHGLAPANTGKLILSYFPPFFHKTHEKAIPPKMFPVNTNYSVSRGTHLLRAQSHLFYRYRVHCLLLKAEKLRLCPHYAE